MIYNLQYLFKPESLTPGPQPGTEIGPDRILSLYCKSLGIPYLVMQVWTGSGEESSIDNYMLINITTQEIACIDHRPQVIEYFIEQIAESIDTSS